MIVCVCNYVSEADIARVVKEGCASFDELRVKLAMGFACGSCEDCARETFRRHAAPPSEVVAPSCRDGQA